MAGRIDPRFYGFLLFILLLLVVALGNNVADKYKYFALVPVCCYQFVCVWDYLELSTPTWLNRLSLSNQIQDNKKIQSSDVSELKAGEKTLHMVPSNDTETTFEKSINTDVKENSSPHEEKSKKIDVKENSSPHEEKSNKIDVKENSSPHEEKSNKTDVKENSSPHESPKSSEPSSTTEFTIVEKRSSLKNGEEKLKLTFTSQDKEKTRSNRSVTFYEKPTFSNNQLEYTKSYYFPHRLKRLQSCLEAPSCNTRRYKVRHWSEKDTDYQVNLQTDSTYNEGNKDTFDCDECELPEDYEQNKKDLNKSYSYPLRQRRRDRWSGSPDRLDDEFNIPALPLWDYCTTSSSRERRRKSVSTDAINRDLKLSDSPYQQKENDFFQSLQLPREDILASNDILGENISKPLSNFNKLKQGIVKRFSKCKKTNSQNRIPFFKDIFTSKENVNPGSAKKLFKGDGYTSTKFMKKEHSPSNISPTYFSYGNLTGLSKPFGEDLIVNPFSS